MGERDMKIAFVSQPFDYLGPPVQGGSLAIWTSQVAHRLARRHDVTIYSRRSPGHDPIQVHQGITYRRIDVRGDDNLARGAKLFERSLGYPRPKRPYFASALYYPGYVRKIARDLRERKVELIHLNNFAQQIPVIRRYNPTATIVIHMHCEWLTQLDYSVIDSHLSRADCIVGCSNYITERIRVRFPHYADRCCTVYNGAGEHHLQRPLAPAHSEEQTSAQPNGTGEGGNSHREKQVLFVGRVSPEKGVHVLLQAMHKVIARDPNVHLTIVGPFGEVPYEYIPLVSDEEKVAALGVFYKGRMRIGDYKAALDRLAAPIADHVTFAGGLPYDELAPIYQQADLLVNPSLSESFGMTLIEAMANDVPVVASRVGGMTEIVEEGVNGLLVASGDADALADAIYSLLENDTRRQAMAQRCRASVVERFTWDAVTQQVESLLRSAQPPLGSPVHVYA